jgi:hypothetical protein
LKKHENAADGDSDSRSGRGPGFVGCSLDNLELNLSIAFTMIGNRQFSSTHDAKMDITSPMPVNFFHNHAN